MSYCARNCAGTFSTECGWRLRIRLVERRRAVGLLGSPRATCSRVRASERSRLDIRSRTAPVCVFPATYDCQASSRGARSRPSGSLGARGGSGSMLLSIPSCKRIPHSVTATTSTRTESICLAVAACRSCWSINGRANGGIQPCLSARWEEGFQVPGPYTRSGPCADGVGRSNAPTVRRDMSEDRRCSSWWPGRPELGCGRNPGHASESDWFE